jgi:hypothetical protein
MNNEYFEIFQINQMVASASYSIRIICNDENGVKYFIWNLKF